MGQEIRGVTIYDIPNQELELDEGILRMKELIKRLDVENVLEPTSESVDIIFEMMSIVRHMDVPIRMNEEGFA